MVYTFWDLFCDNLDKPWNWYWISQNPNITLDIILNNPDKPWDWPGISRNPNITCEIIQANPDKQWDWKYISYNFNITPLMIRDNLDKPWDWYILSKNKMNQPYYSSYHHKKHLANQLASAIFEELIAVTCNPRRHPANYMPICELSDHPFGGLCQSTLDDF